jgi:hypothetical protein
MSRHRLGFKQSYTQTAGLAPVSAACTLGVAKRIDLHRPRLADSIREKVKAHWAFSMDAASCLALKYATSAFACARWYSIVTDLQTHELRKAWFT